MCARARVATECARASVQSSYCVYPCVCFVEKVAAFDLSPALICELHNPQLMRGESHAFKKIQEVKITPKVFLFS